MKARGVVGVFVVWLAVGCIPVRYDERAAEENAAAVARREVEPQRADEARCNKDDADACIRAAGRLASGDGVPRDLTRAARFYRRACDLGEAAACDRLAALPED